MTRWQLLSTLRSGGSAATRRAACRAGTHPGHVLLFTLTLTLGHGTATRDQLLELLRGADIKAVGDVRTASGSRRNPDATRSAMEQWIPEHGIGYCWEQRLGGWRRDPADSLDTALRNRSLAGYAAHMRSACFGTAVDDLLAAAAATRTAVLCAESVWWRCHRRVITESRTRDP